jgi:hypothetical protein
VLSEDAELDTCSPGLVNAILDTSDAILLAPLTSALLRSG